MKFLVTGSKGYIGSHMTHFLREKGHDVVELKSDLRNAISLDVELSEHRFDAVFHFAGLIQVGESVKMIHKYYETNVMGTLNLLNTIAKYDVTKKVIFSSSAAAGLLNSPYGTTKKIGELLLDDFERSHGIKYVALRYFNAAGANVESGLYENHDPETHIIPLMLKAALHKTQFTIFGNDYDTPDGTCIRDYIHVDDLVRAHLLAYEYLINNESFIFDLGTGTSTSNLELLNKITSITGLRINYKIGARREGDPAILVACPQYAESKLGWKSQCDIEEIISSAYTSLHNRL